MKIDIWSDYACPFCYLGETRLKKAIEAMGDTDVELQYRSFQLDPNATAHPNETMNELIANKYGIPVEQAKASNDRIVQAAAESGLTYDFDKIKPNNTRRAHEVTKLAKDKGLEDAVAERLFAAYFEEGVDLNQEENLLRLSEEAGLNKDDVSKALEDGRYKDAVLSDQQQAGAMGISSVPFFVINDQYSISGAQSEAYFMQALEQIKDSAKES